MALPTDDPDEAAEDYGHDDEEEDLHEEDGPADAAEVGEAEHEELEQEQEQEQQQKQQQQPSSFSRPTQPLSFKELTKGEEDSPFRDEGEEERKGGLD